MTCKKLKDFLETRRLAYVDRNHFLGTRALLWMRQSCGWEDYHAFRTPFEVLIFSLIAPLRYKQKSEYLLRLLFP
jgi:hypothetical protein